MISIGRYIRQNNDSFRSFSVLMTRYANRARTDTVRTAVVTFGGESTPRDVTYALWVHEDKNTPHLNPVGAKAKFLEDTSKDEKVKRVMASIIVNGMKGVKADRKGALLAVLEEAAKYLLEETKPFVPVDTGALLRSGRAGSELKDTK